MAGLPNLGDYTFCCVPTAILIDGGFFLKGHRFFFGKTTPKRVAEDLERMCLLHLRQESTDQRAGDGSTVWVQKQLYRVFFYDCPPLAKKVRHPLTKEEIDLSQTTQARWRNELHLELRAIRKLALRLGYLNERTAVWGLREKALKGILAGTRTKADLSKSDLFLDAVQKGVDMRIGLDIASMAFKRQVDQIILVSGDSDFVPAAKLARREGIDVILDPLGANIREDLHEHVDGIRTVWVKASAGLPDAV